MVGIQRHELDEANLVRATPGELRERDHLVLGEPADRDRVDLDRVGLWEGRQLLEAPQDLIERVAPGEGVEAVALERVDRHVEAVDSGLHQRASVSLQEEAVGREGDLREIFDLAKHRGQAWEVTPDKRLPAGQPDVADAHLGEKPH